MNNEFWNDYENARKVTSIGGELCKLVGGFLPIVVLVASIGLGASHFGFGLGIGGTVLAFALALAGAPIAALGTIATESKRQTHLMALDLKYTR